MRTFISPQKEETKLGIHASVDARAETSTETLPFSLISN